MTTESKTLRELCNLPVATKPLEMEIELTVYNVPQRTMEYLEKNDLEFASIVNGIELAFTSRVRYPLKFVCFGNKEKLVEILTTNQHHFLCDLKYKLIEIIGNAVDQKIQYYKWCGKGHENTVARLEYYEKIIKNDSNSNLKIVDIKE